MTKKTPSLSNLITWVYTEDLESTCDFYQNRIGLKAVREEGIAVVFDAGNSGNIGVCRAFEDRIVEPDGGMITFVTDDVDSWFSHLKSNGVKISSPPHILEQFKIYTFFLKDPNGYRLEFQQFLE